MGGLLQQTARFHLEGSQPQTVWSGGGGTPRWDWAVWGTRPPRIRHLCGNHRLHVEYRCRLSILHVVSRGVAADPQGRGGVRGGGGSPPGKLRYILELWAKRQPRKRTLTNLAPRLPALTICLVVGLSLIISSAVRSHSGSSHSVHIRACTGICV